MQRYLEKLNSHERDSLLLFDEKYHSYSYKGMKLISSTSLIHKLFIPFNADDIINDMQASPLWERNKYYPMTKEQIKNLWSKNSEEAMIQGTKLHADIESYLNYEVISNESKEFQFFLNFMKDKKFVPYRTEWKIFDEDMKIAGTIDACSEDENGELTLFDWKRSKEIKKSNDFKKKYSIKEYLKHLEDVNFNHYSLQLNLYKYILQKKYKKKIKDMYLAIFHPECITQNYQIYLVPDMTEEIKNIMNDYASSSL